MEISIAIPEDSSLAVVHDRPVEQQFLSRVDGLCRVECCLARHGRSRVAPVTLTLCRISGSPPGTAASRVLVARRHVPDPAIRDNGYQLDLDRSRTRRGPLPALVIESRRGRRHIAPWALTRALLLGCGTGSPLPAKSQFPGDLGRGCQSKREAAVPAGPRR
jgi:hypothetical protein